jgi:hypothetical protein
MRSRPGLVLFGQDSLPDHLDLTEPSQVALLIRLRELFLTASRLGVETVELLEQIHACLPEFASQAVWLPTHVTHDPAMAASLTRDLIDRCAAELPRGPALWQRRPGMTARAVGSTPHSIRTSFNDDEAPSRSR